MQILPKKTPHSSPPPSSRSAASSGVRSATIVLIATACLLGAATGASADDAAASVSHAAPAASAIEHLRVTWRGDASTTAIVSWSTASVGAGHALAWRPAGAAEWRRADCHRSGEFSRGGGLWFHHAQLADLELATQYEVIAQSDGRESDVYSFRTAPAAGAPFQLLFGGDSRSGREHRRKMNELLRRLVDEAREATRPPVIALAHGGDFVNNGRKLAEWREWLDDYMITTSKRGELLPIIPTRGNHDYGELFNELFDFPEGNPNYYTTTLTPTVTLLTLNTETSTAGDQQAWLERQLAKPAPQRQWLLCQYHKPAFPAVKVPSGAYASWVPLFEKYGVDLALEADGHCIKRTPPILGHEIDPAGVVYIGEGGLGVGQRTPHTDRWYLQPPAVTGQGHHVHLLSFDGAKMTGRVILEEGSIFDEFTHTPRETSPANNETVITPAALGP